MSFSALNWSELSLQVMVTFVHFLWQACVVGIVWFVLQYVGESFRKLQIVRQRGSGNRSYDVSLGETDLRGANVRYTLACIAFFALPICVAITFAWVYQSRGPVLLAAGNSMESPTYPVASANEVMATTVDTDVRVLPPSEKPIDAEVPTAEPTDLTSLTVPEPSLTQRIQKIAPYLLLAYMVGVAVMLARFCLSIIGSSRLRRTNQPIADATLLKTIAEQCARLGLKRIPIVAISQRVSVPVVIGIVKPLILLPPALLCGLDPNQVAAVVSHEMAHIRRFDLIVNLLQRIVEALLFFHPITWWISHHVSIEREHCCDELAATSVGRLSYAGALLKMAELCIGNDRRRSKALATLSADGGNSTDFGYRIRRLIGAEETTRVGVTRRSAAIALATIALLTVSLVGRVSVGEFSGAAHGALLAAWQSPDEVLDHEATAPSGTADRLGDGIQWSRWGAKDGLLSGARLILPRGGLNSGQPLVVEYRLANVSTETKTLKCYLNNGMQFTSLGHGNRISGFGFDRHREPVTIAIQPGDVFIDTEHLVSIDTTGLEPGKYQAALGSAFFYPDLNDPNATHEIPHRGSIPFMIVGESTVKTVELTKNDIHWGQPIAGLQLGAKYLGDATQFAIGATVEADLFIANVTDKPIECSVVLPHPGDGWLFNVEDNTGSTLMLERHWPRDFFSPQRYVHLHLAPGEMAPITGESVKTSMSSASTEEAFATTLPKARFQIVGTKEEAKQLRHDSSDSLQATLISEGGAYAAIFEVTLLRPEIPALRLELDSGNVPFTVLGPKLKLFLDDASQTTAKLPNTYDMQFDVVDDNGQPIDNVAILYKEDEATWYEGETSDHATGADWIPFRIVEEGKPTYQAATPAILGMAHVLIAAKGFEPVTLKLNEQPERGQHIVKHVQLKPARPVEFILMTNADLPAAGATLETLKAKELRAAIAQNGGSQLNQFLNFNVISDARGSVRFPRPAFTNWTTYRIEHPAGYVDVRGKDLPVADTAKSSVRRIQLTPYASINVSYRPQVKANESLEMYRLKANRKTVDGRAQLITLDQDGRLVVSKLLAGWYTFVHRVRFADNSTTASAMYVPFALKEGENRDLVLGADGRSVVGRFVLPNSDEVADRTLSVSVASGSWPGYPVPPQELDSAATLAWWNVYWETEKGRQFRDYNLRNFKTSLAKDGSFHFPSLPPGDYRLSLDVLQPAGTQAQLVQTKFEVPDDKQSEPIELGDMTVNVEPQKQQKAAQPDSAKKTQDDVGQSSQEILGQWDVSTMAGAAGFVPDAESMTLKFSEPDRFESYTQKQDYIGFASGSWKLEGGQIAVKFKSVTMQPSDNSETEAKLQILASDVLVWNGNRFHKRLAAIPVTLSANHPLSAVVGELLAERNANSPNESWQLVEVSDKPEVKTPQILNNSDASKAGVYHLLLARDYRESANTMQQFAAVPNEEKFRIRTEQIEIVLYASQPTAAVAELKSQIVWLPPKSRWPTHDICLGDGLGYTWFVRAPIQDCHALKENLRLVGGDDMLATLVRSLISAKNMPPRSDANTAAAILMKYGDRAVTAVEQAVREKKPEDELWHLIGSLAGIRTDASTKLLIQLYQSEDADIRRAAAYALIHKPYRREAALVYLDLLKNRMSVEATTEASIELGLTNAIPILEELFTNVTKPSSLHELNRIFAARRTLQGNPISKPLLDASEIIYQSRASDPAEEGSVIGNAIKQIAESDDHEAVIMLALQMTNYTTKGSVDHIRSTGAAILKSQKSAEGVLFLTRVLDSLPPREREQILKTISPLAPPATASSLTPPANSPQPSPYSTLSAAATPIPTGPRELVATIFGTTVYRDQLVSESAKAKLSKLPQDQVAAKRLENEGEALLSWISRRAVEDYVRREKIEISPEMSAKLLEAVNATELTTNADSTLSEEQRRGMLHFMMRGSLMDWLVCKSLYERYGGRVGMGSLGLWIAVDGRNELMREYLRKESIVISETELEKAFWKAANKPNFADAYPKGDQLKLLMSAPPFLSNRITKSSDTE